MTDDRSFESPFERSVRYDGDRLLYRSPNYTVRSSWEEVFLEGRALRSALTIGDFYGNPAAAVIDPEERWCVMVGAGLITYRLGAPWAPYVYDQGTDQWFEWGRGADALWLDEAAWEEGRFRVVSLPDDGWIVREFSVDPLARSVTAVRERLDEAARQRDAVERAFAGRAVTQLVVDADRLEIHAGDAHRLVVWGSVNIQPTHRDPWRSVGVSAIPADVLAQLRTVIAEKIISVHARPDTDLMIQIESEFRRAKGVPGFVISAGSLDTPLGRWRLEAPEGAVESLAAPAAERP